MATNPKMATLEVRVRYHETDAMGFLHHANYFVFFEMGRTELLRVTGVPYRKLEELGLYYVVAKLECRYKAPAFYDDVLTLETTIHTLRRYRADHSYRLTRGDKLIAEAASTLVLVDRSGKPTHLPDDLYYTLRGEVPPDEPRYDPPR